jgi:hypothetical protein
VKPKREFQAMSDEGEPINLAELSTEDQLGKF